MKYWTIALILLLVVCGNISQAEDMEKNTVAVLSFNIRFDNPLDGEDAWSRRKDFALDIMRQGNYDFIGLQEVLIRPDKETSQLNDIEKNLSAYGVIYRSREIDETRGESMPVFYRNDRWELDPKENGTFWLSATPDEIGSNTWDAACRRVATWGRFTDKKTGKSLYFMNTHYDHVSEKARQNSSVLIADFLAKRRHPDEPVILTGDFNCGEKSVSVRYLQGETVTMDQKTQTPAIRLIDTFRVVHPDGPEQGSFHGFKGIPSNSRIDYVFSTPGVEVIQSDLITISCEGRFPSDHFPIEAKLRLP